MIVMHGPSPAATGSPTIAITIFRRVRQERLLAARGSMFRIVALTCLVMASLSAPPVLAADLLPHEGNYAIRLGTSPTAPQVGTARQLLGMDCQVWRLERDIKTDIGLAAGLRLTSESELRGAEPRDGSAFDYQLRRAQNGREQSISGRVKVGKNSAQATIVWPSRPVTVDLPTDIVLPVAGFARVIDALKGGATSFSFALFDPELTGDALQIDGGIIPADTLRPARADAPKLPEGATWPVEISFTRAGGRALFTVTLLMHEAGLLDRLTINTGLIAASADLVTFKPLPRPDCPTS